MSLVKMSFLERIQDQPQSHHFLIELPTYSPTEDRDFDTGNVHDLASGESVDCNLRDRAEIRRRSSPGPKDTGRWSFNSGCDVGSAMLNQI
ncbi:hypothetical protein V6N12_030622 [Hibiscus sabdariffa]|uniref:Uncharacterized protein n=1 Tax=Hibiscus sabdariffa TaxID=183260 RepID=A0ABR2A956_9ROSI